MLRNIALCLLLCGLSVSGFAQALGILKGQVTDESGAVIPNTKVTAAGPNGVVKSTTTVADGTYTLTGLAPGAWTVQASSPGLTQFQPAKVNISGGTQTLNIQLRVALEKQEVTVQEQGNNTVSTDPSNNASSLVLKGADLDMLSDDPDDLQQDLEALAGPAAGPNGGQIYIDGFTGGRLPPKESIREIRINQNPFSSEYDRLGYGRIEILTKPGTDKFRGQGFFNISDGTFNSRNPFLLSPIQPDFQTRQYGGNLSGPLSKKASFFFDFDRREIDDSNVVNAQTLDSNFNEIPFSTAIATPQRRTSFSPRLDYALNPNNTLMARYTYTRNDLLDTGVGTFDLPGRGYSSLITEHTGQLTETAVINSRIINETRLQIIRQQTGDNGNNLPVINVAQSFTTGGSGVGLSYSQQDHWELQNYTSTTIGAHALKFGVRLRDVSLTDFSQSNFGGTFTFSGSQGISSLDAYRITQLGLQQGLTMAEIRAMGGGPSQFSLNVGNPRASVSQLDAGLFVQDDWRWRPNFTLSFGLRYETQTNVHDWHDLAPRFGFAWAPGTSKAMGPFSRPKIVIRGGFGIFYDRISENLTLQEIRFGAAGPLEQSIRVFNPDFYPNVPPVSLLPSPQQSQITYQLDKNIRAPYVQQGAIGVERQLPWNTSIAVTYTYSHAAHLLRTRDINAPLPGTFVPGDRNSGVRPYGNVGEIYNYESTGILNQNQLITNINSRINSRISLFGGYFYNHAKSNTDGVNSLPANDYDLSTEYGRSSLDVHHRAMFGGSIATRWDVRLNPFVVVSSGGPFNITTGQDLNGDASYTDRPALVAPGTTGPSIVYRPGFGWFDLNPYLPNGQLKPGETILPRNFGQGPGSVTLNLRLSKTWGFGPERSTSARSQGGGGGGDHGPGDHGPRGGGGGRGFGGPGGGGMRMGGMGGGMRGMFDGGGSSSRRYTLTLSVNARNLLNHTNFGPFTGNLTSPFFGTSNSLAGGFGAERNPVNNRRIEFSLRFAF